jgi:hypothetical protein
MAKQETQQPQYAPQPDPNAQYGPAPQPQNTPYQQQPVNQQYFAQPQAAPVQYVVMAESLKGIKGWLAFLTILMGLGGILFTLVFFGSLLDISTAAGVVSVIFAPVVAILSIVAVILINLQKKIARYFSIASYMTGAAYLSVLQIVLSASEPSSDSNNVTTCIAVVALFLLTGALMSLYFILSRRVKETLVD